MPEQPNVLPGEIILASVHNAYRDRTLQRYTSNSQRDSLNPIPAIGEMAWITGTDELQIFASGGWTVIPNNNELIVEQLRIAVLAEAASAGDYSGTTKSLGSGVTTLEDLTLPSPGTWLVECNATYSIDTTGTGSSDWHELQLANAATPGTIVGRSRVGGAGGSSAERWYPASFAVPITVTDPNITLRLQSEKGYLLGTHRALYWWIGARRLS